MGATNTRHRPLVGGILVTSAVTVGDQLRVQGGGTLTGLATRNSDNKKVLASNLQVARRSKLAHRVIRLPIVAVTALALP